MSFDDRFIVATAIADREVQVRGSYDGPTAFVIVRMGGRPHPYGLGLYTGIVFDKIWFKQPTQSVKINATQIGNQSCSAMR